MDKQLYIAIVIKQCVKAYESIYPTLAGDIDRPIIRACSGSG